MKATLLAFTINVLMLNPALLASLASVKSEPNLERRSELALENADHAIDAARTAYKASDDKAFADSVKEVEDSVALSYQSLQDTGKKARRSPKYFKRADLKMRALARRMEALEHEVGMEDRPRVEAAKTRIHDIDDQIVFDIMSKK
jgi:hypothetical protein